MADVHNNTENPLNEMNGCPAMNNAAADSGAPKLSAKQTLFAKLGGSGAVAAAVDIFYKKVLADPDLAPFFEVRSGVMKVYMAQQTSEGGFV